MDPATSRPVPAAIIGIGCLFPKAEDPARFWANIREGVDAITEVPPTHWRPEDYFDADPKAPDRTYAHRGGFLSPVDFPPLDFGITPNTLEATDTTQLLGLMAARQALADAGYGGGGRAFDRGRVSVVLGVTGTLELVIPLAARLGHPLWRRALAESGVAPDVADDVVKRIGEGYVGWQEDSFPGLLGNVVAGRIANRLDLGGTNCVVDAACASSLGAVHLAMLELGSGRSDMVVTGGMDTFNDIFMYMCFSKTPALSPTGDARPFAAEGDGTILGEGLGCLVLKRLDDAERDGDKVYAVIRAVGSSSDGKGHAIYAPSSAGQVRALEETYRLAGVTPDSIELVEGHGTGTLAGDAAEAAALAKVYGGADREGSWCALGSVKSQIGHTKAAAGAAGLIKAAMALHHKVLPPTIKVGRPIDALMPGASPFYVNTEKRPWLPSADHPRRAAVSAFGFGGSNYHCVLEEYRPEADGVDWDGDVQVLAFSGESPEAVRSAIVAWPAGLGWDGVRSEAARAREAFDPGHPCRVALVAERKKGDLDRLLAGAKAGWEEPPTRPSWSTPDGVFFGHGPAPGGLAMLFPGQGAQYPGMFRDLACRFPAMQRALAEADLAFAADRGPGEAPRLSDFVYPRPTFDPAGPRRDEEALRATEVAQPALGAVALGALGILDGFGVRPGAVAGHSYGELPSLCAAGLFDAGTLHRLSRLRGRSMAEGSGDRGAMLAVLAPRESIESVLGEDGLTLVVANKNAPRQSVLSGASGEIDRAREAFARRSIQAVPLSVAAAFHSPFVADARHTFSAALDDVDLRSASIPVFANTTGRAYPADPAEARDLLAGQLAEPVEFVSLVENMHDEGFHTFLEVGPGGKLTGLVAAILAGRPHAAFSLDASGGSRGGMADLARTLAQVAALGHEVELARWDDSAPATPRADRKATLTVPLCGANYVKPKSPAAPALPGKPAALDRPAAPAVTTNGNGKAPAAGYGNGTATNGNGRPVAARPAPVPVPPRPQAQAPTPAIRPVAPTADVPSAGEFLRATQQSLVALQDLGEQTARLHRQFLEGQDRALQVFQTLLEQQQGIAQASLGMTAPRAVAPAAIAPQPVPRAIEIRVPGVERSEPPANPVPAPDLPGAQLRLDPGHTGPGASPASGGEAEAALLAVVSEKTGYPAEMLELGMEIEADLGIDSIKRVEIFGALQERLPDAPPIKAEHLGSLRTLKQVVDFLAGPSASPVPAVAPPVVATPRPAAKATPVRRYVVSPIALDSRADHPASHLLDGGEIWIVDDGSDLAPAVARHLEAIGHRARVVSLAGLGDLQAPTILSGLAIVAPHRADDAFLKDSLRLLQVAGPGLREAARLGGSAFVTVSRLDGSFGLAGGIDDFDPTSGGLAGLAKTAGHEWPEVRAKAIDLDPAFADLDDAARQVVEEIRLAGPAEVGISSAGRRTLEVREAPLQGQGTARPIARGDVVVVTGGARGVTAEVAVAMARAFAPTLVLLGRSPAPSAEPGPLASLKDEAAIKRAILAGLNGKAAPKEVEAEFRAVMANREVIATLARIEAAGGRAVYHQVDVRDAKAVEAVVAGVRREHGPIRGLIHGAGVLADGRIEAKTAEQFDRVYGTKVDGLRALLAATSGDDLGLIVVFSSSTGRFGRVGQVDYAVANEVLNKMAGREARRRPACRVVSPNWGPWDGGMVTPALKGLFAAEGMGLIPLDGGADYLVREITQDADRPVEVVVLGGGLPTSTPTPTPAESAAMATVFERSLTIESMPVLKSHVIDGRAVLPMAITLEWLAHGALHGNPGLYFHGVDGLRVLRGVFVDGDAPTAVRVVAGKAIKRDGLFLVPTELRGRADGREVVHARAEVALTTALPAGGRSSINGDARPYHRETSALYRDMLFHGRDLQGIARVEDCSERRIAASVSAAPPPDAWIAEPLRNGWLADPLVLDSCFQMMIVWSFERHEAGSLPCYLGRYRQYRRSFPKEGLRVVATITKDAPGLAVADIEVLDASGEVVARLEGYECVIDASLNPAFRRNRLGR